MKYIKLIVIVTTLFLTLYAKDYRALVRVKNIVASNGEVHKISDFGNYYAILIYVQDYENLPRLQTPKKDVEDIADILKSRYGFKEVKIVANPKNSDDLIEILDKYKRKLSQNDNLLIYYAGHGSKNGYWQLKKAKKDSRVGWIPIKEAINSTLKDMLSKHILVVADSCYSGYLTRDGVNISTLSKNDKLYYTKLYRLKSRNVLTSGGLQPVLDKDPSNPNHSIFANAFLKILKNNKTPIFSVEEKFPKIKRYVQLNSEQTPLYADVRQTGHQDGGDFIFVDRGAVNLKKNNPQKKNPKPKISFKGFEKTFGSKKYDVANAITPTKDGGFIVAGGTKSFGNGEDAYLIKIDKDGNKIWQKTFGGKDNDWVYAITPTKDGGFIVAGITESFGNGEDVYLIKIDKDGNKIWQKTFGGKDDDWAFAITPTKDSGFIVAGWSDSFGNEKKDVYLIKIDKSGNKIWQKTFGGKDLDKANAITPTKDGGFIVAGVTGTLADGKVDAYLIKIDKDGNIKSKNLNK